MDDLIERIMNSDKWPSIQFSENLELLNGFANQSFELNTFDGKLAALLMYHQIIESMCMHLLDCCRFFIQLSLYPTEINFKNLPKKQMLGSYIENLKTSIAFFHKDDFIRKVESFNSIRNNVIHRMKKSNLMRLLNSLSSIREKFDDIFNIYNLIQDNFRVDFHRFQTDVFTDYIDEKE